MRISDWSSDVCSSDLARVAAEITCGVDRALDLNHAVALVPGETDGKAQFVVAVMAPNAARIAALARFVPTLDEVMVHVRRRRAGEFRIGVVGLPGSGVAGFAPRSCVPVDAEIERASGGERVCTYE